MNAKQLSSTFLTLVLLACAPSPGRLTFSTGAPALLEDGYGYLNPLPEKEYREYVRKHLGEEGFVPLARGPSGLSDKALFDTAQVLDRTVTLAVDGDEDTGYSLVVDLDADGSLKNDPVWPMKRQTLTLPDFEGLKVPMEAWVGEVDTVLEVPAAGKSSGAPFSMAVAITEEMVRLPGTAAPRRKALSTESTLRRGSISIRGTKLAFGLRGEAGLYGDDYDCLVFDLNGDGRLDTLDRTSPEYYWVWEKTVHLAGEAYEFRVDRFGGSLTLEPDATKIPDRANLGVGGSAPDFAFTDLSGRSHRLKDYRGQVVLLDFWGTWCPACAAHAGELATAYGTLHGKGFEIIGIHEGGDEKSVREFTAAHGMTWPQTLETGSVSQARPAQRLYRILGAPNYFLLDRNGRIVLSGEHKPSAFLHAARELLSSPP